MSWPADPSRPPLLSYPLQPSQHILTSQDKPTEVVACSQTSQCSAVCTAAVHCSAVHCSAVQCVHCPAQGYTAFTSPWTPRLVIYTALHSTTLLTTAVQCTALQCPALHLSLVASPVRPCTVEHGLTSDVGHRLLWPQLGSFIPREDPRRWRSLSALSAKQRMLSQ